MKPAIDETNTNPSWQRQDTGPGIQGAIAKPTGAGSPSRHGTEGEARRANEIDWRPFLTRLIATLQQLNDPGLNDEQRVAGLQTLVRELSTKLGMNESTGAN
jgi:hypothetical protein